MIGAIAIRFSTVFFITCLLMLSMKLTAFPPNPAGKKQPANHNLQISSGVAFFGFKDALQSPRAYAGNGWSAGAGYDRFKTNRLWSLETQLYQGNANNQLRDNFGGNTAQVFGLQMNSARLWRVKAPLGRLQWYAGFSTQGYTQIRSNAALGNSSLGYDAMVGWGGVSRLEFPFRLKSDKTYRLWIFKYTRKSFRLMRLGWQLELPVAAAHMRTPYVGLTNTLGNEPMNGLFQDLKENTRFVLAGNYLYLRNQFYGHYSLKNGNALSLQWQWTGYAYTYNNQPTRSANGQLLLGLRIKLDSHNEQRR